jgi:hypothetical protein
VSTQRPDESFEKRSRALFEDSVENLDMRVRSRLTQARHAALAGTSRPARFRARWWTPAAGLAAAAILGVALWMGTPAQHAVSLTDAQSIEDLDLLASSEGSGDAIDMLQDDIEFYDFADRVAESEPAA